MDRPLANVPPYADAPLVVSRRQAIMGLAAVGITTGLGACGLAQGGQAAGGGVDGWGGELEAPGLPAPDVTLTTAHGEPFPIRRSMRGRAALLAFGYTNCPDVCPVYLHAIATAMQSADFDGTEPPRVVFVGVDPARDTPVQLRRYLDRIDPQFTGLTGSRGAIAALNRGLHNGPISIGVPDANGDYAVQHAAGILAFTPDGLAHRRYPPDTRPQAWVHDLPRLARGAYR